MLVISAMILLLAVPLTSLMSSNFSKHRRILINRILFCCIFILAALGLLYVESQLVWIYIVFMLPVLAILGVFLYRLEQQLAVMKTPIEYLAFYFPCLGIVLFTGLCDSPFFPEIFLCSILFVVAHSGRRVSFGLGIVCTVSIIALFWHGLVTDIHTFVYSDTHLVRIIMTVALMVLIPQLHRYLYTKRLKQLEL